MKINEVEQIVGISKKNIRFYEEQGLLSPVRDKSNGYREYSDDDVQLLLKIRLLRRLSFPIEEIRNLLEGRLSLDDCIARHLIYLRHEKSGIEYTEEICLQIAEEKTTLAGLTAGDYLERLDELEKGGTRFMNISGTDISRKKKRGARIAAAVMISLVSLWDLVLIVSLIKGENIPTGVFLLMTVPPTAVIAGIIVALRQRINEIDGGEEDEAVYY